MLHDLLMDIKLDKFGYYRHLETTAIESACSEMSVGQLEDILRKYTTSEDMFTQQYLHGTYQNIKLLVDMGRAVDNPEIAEDVDNRLREKEPLYYR
jgi:hypothetical protein